MPILLLLFAACGPDGSAITDMVSMSQVDITLSGDGDLSGFSVTLRNVQTGSVFESTTNADASVSFAVTPGIYEATATGKRASDGIAYSYNGTSGQLTVLKGSITTATIAMRCARQSQVVIKEVYNGGCLKDDGVTKFQYDKCIILYNNSSQTASLSNLCIGEASPANAQQQNKNIDASGRLTYESEGFIPVWNGIWYFPSVLEIEPYSQIVINVHGAIDNTLTVSQSVNYANADYYCMYDPESGYNNTNYYPTPSAVIPTSHYLRAIEIGQGNGWALSVTSPALIVFQTHDITPTAYAANADNIWYDGGQTGNKVWACFKVPTQWIVDGIEVFSSGYKDSSTKRLTADVDAGYVWLTNYQGHSLYRNVDAEATRALPENEGLLVEGYTGGVDDSTDPSGIDAEASMRRGAHIIFQDTNLSTNDFHERRRCSLTIDN